MSDTFAHDRDTRGTSRLCDRDDALVDLLRADAVYPDGHTVLKVGCGAGAQTITGDRSARRAAARALGCAPALQYEA